MNRMRMTMTTETKPCRMLEGIPLRLLLSEANRHAAARAQREAETRAFTDSDLTDGERLFGSAVNS